jgi:hypothetical protein
MSERITVNTNLNLLGSKGYYAFMIGCISRYSKLKSSYPSLANDALPLKKEGAAFTRTAPPLDSLLYATQFLGGAAPRPPPMPPPASSRFSLSSSPESVPVQDMLKFWPLTLRT